MALKTNELFSSVAGVGSQKRVAPTVLKSKEFALGTGTLKKGTLVAYNTTTLGWVPWVNAGANGAGTMLGVLWPDDLTLDAANETISTVMIEGRIHRDDVELNGQTQPNVDTELQTGARSVGIHVDGLADVR